ncbi:hypothetical protein CDV36_001586 [Fusarium kuroshium]|uniref:Uncharacterized protein n=1 Tax=Fusarium kuroshium TaxID=2010991 RepID=A0A3M2SNN9_9HYPO|nr:hypothetical protein CDV36_001586 [Fusarium kuroshium]
MLRTAYERDGPKHVGDFRNSLAATPGSGEKISHSPSCTSEATAASIRLWPSSLPKACSRPPASSILIVVDGRTARLFAGYRSAAIIIIIILIAPHGAFWKLVLMLVSESWLRVNSGDVVAISEV